MKETNLTSSSDISVLSSSGRGVFIARTMQLAAIARRIKCSNLVKPVKDQFGRISNKDGIIPVRLPRERNDPRLGVRTPHHQQLNVQSKYFTPRSTRRIKLVYATIYKGYLDSTMCLDILLIGFASSKQNNALCGLLTAFSI